MLPNAALAALTLLGLVAVLVLLTRRHRTGPTHLLGAACLIATTGVVGSVLAISRLTVGPVGLAAAIDYVEAIGWPAIERHERSLVEAAVRGLEAVSYTHLTLPTNREV